MKDAQCVAYKCLMPSEHHRSKGCKGCVACCIPLWPITGSFNEYLVPSVLSAALHAYWCSELGGGGGQSIHHALKHPGQHAEQCSTCKPGLLSATWGGVVGMVCSVWSALLREHGEAHAPFLYFDVLHIAPVLNPK